MNIKIISIIIISALVLGFISSGLVCFLQAKKNESFQKELQAQKINVKVVSFLDAFIKKVLNAQGEVSFEDRLKLENAVRDLNDKEILTAWENFTQSETPDFIQQNVKLLLEKLVSKIIY